MSATGRNLAGHERHADDDYATPAWCTQAILPHLAVREGIVLDPCCGAGGILDVFRATWPNRLTKGIEINEARCALAAAQVGYPNVAWDNALLPSCEWPSCDAIVTNPPYSLALAFIEKALTCSDRIDKAFLLRLNFLGSQKRARFHREHPADIFVLPRRPSFTNGGTDATEYAWFVWGPERGNRWFVLEV